MKKFFKAILTILAYPLRLFNGVSFRAIIFDSLIHRTSKIQKRCSILYSTVGKYTYICENSRVVKTCIGAYCSIGSFVIIGGGSHKMDNISTSPLFVSGSNIFKKNFSRVTYNAYKQTIIENDVWIGNRAIILQGVKIGTGAVIGAGAVVTKDVPPYAIVVGAPARIIKYRFDNNVISLLLASKWWTYSDKDLCKCSDFTDDIVRFIDEIKK